MNRRQAIRNAVSVGAAVAALPVMSKIAEANDPISAFTGQGCGGPVCAPAYTPPPPDTRTPEQILVDQHTEEVADVVRHLTHEMYPGQRRYAYSTWSWVFTAVQAEIRAQSLPIETRVIAGVGDVLVGSNGNIARRIG